MTDANGVYVFDSAQFSEAAASGTQGTLLITKTGYLATSGAVTATPPYPKVTDFSLIPGTVVLLEGTITNRATGAPIAGATLHVYGNGFAEVKTDAAGHYSVTGNQYPYTSGTLYVDAPGYYSLQQVAFNNAPLVMDLTMLPGGPVLQGTVRDASTGALIAGASVTYSGTGTYQWQTTQRSTMTDANGVYVFDSAQFSEAAATGTQGTLNVNAPPSYFPANQSVNAAPPWPRTFDVNMTGTGATVSITVGTNMPGLAFQVDGVEYSMPQVFTWTPHHVHMIATTSPQAETGDTRRTFTGWSDGGAISRAIVTPNTSGSFTANFVTQYLLTTAADPSSAGTVTSGGWFNANSVVTLTAVPSAGYRFDRYTGDLTTTSNPVNVTITGPKLITAHFAPLAPVATDGTVTTAEDTAAAGMLAASVGDSSPLSFSIVSNGTLGTAVVTNPATGAFTYVPNANANGADTFTFTATANGFESNVATFTVTIVPVNDAPVASTGTLTTDEDVATSGTLVADDVDVTPVTYVIVSGPTQGTVSLMDASAGTYVYTPNPNVNGADSFTFKANDGAADSNVATVTVTIVPVNDAPVVANVNLLTSYTAAVNTQLSASDVDSSSLTFSILQNGSKGTANVTNGNQFQYAPDPGASGTDVVTYRANDGSLDSNVATVTIDLVSVNVVTPNGGERVFVNVPYVIQWTATHTDTIDVELSRDAGLTWTAVAGCTGLAGSATSCTWTPTTPATTAARVQVTGTKQGRVARDVSAANFTIANSAPSITVTSPNTGMSWAAGSQHSITWNHNLGSPSSVRIELSRDGGATWESVAASVPNSATSGAFDWTVSGPLTATALIRVTWLDGPESDVSNTSFAIVAPTVTVTTPNTNVNWAIGSNRNLTWSHNLGTAESVRIDLSRDSGSTWELIAPSVPNSGATSGTFAWVVNGPVTSAARIRVTWTDDNTVQDTSAVDFRVSSPITVTSPNTSVTWAAGSTRTVAWTHDYGAAQTFDIAVSPDNGATWFALASAVPAASATTGTFTGTMPATVSTQALVRVSPAGNAGDGDVSNVTFTLAVASITVTAPNTNVGWTVGTARNIAWAHNLGTAEAVRLEVSRDGGATWSVVTSSVTNSGATAGTFSWVVNGPVTSTARVRASWVRDDAVTDMSDVDFRVLSAITVTSPNTAVTWGAGTRRAINWNHSLGAAATFDIAFSADNGATWTPLASGVPATTATAGSFPVVMPSTLTTTASIRVSPAGDPGTGDVSNVSFTLAAPTITVTAPNTNVNWPIGSNRNITWSHNLGTMERVEIAISRDGGATWTTFASLLPTSNTSGSFLWPVEGPATTTARIRMRWEANPAISDMSNVNFRIQ
jgi:hypothetical protein